MQCWVMEFYACLYYDLKQQVQLLSYGDQLIVVEEDSPNTTTHTALELNVCLDLYLHYYFVQIVHFKYV